MKMYLRTLFVASAALVANLAGAQTAMIGDLFAGTCDGATQLDEIDVFTRQGVYLAAFNGPSQGSCLTGMTFDGGDDLHVISAFYGTSTWGVLQFDPNGNLFASIKYFTAPTSIAHDQQGNLYVANGNIEKIDGGGTVTTLTVAGGARYVTITPDQQTLVYSASNGDVKSFSLATLSQGPDYGVGTAATIVRMLPDNSLLLDSGGAVQHWISKCAGCYPYRRKSAYQLPANSSGFTLDPDGATFWSINAYYDSVNNQGHGDISQANITSGQVLANFSLPLLGSGRYYSGSIGIAGDGSDTTVTTPSTLTYATQAYGSTSPAKGLTVTNTGVVDLVISRVAITGDFAIKTNACVKGVLPGAHCSIGITFTPTQLGTRTGTLTIYDNTSNSPQTVALSGFGQAVTTTTISSSLNPSIYGQVINLTAQVASNAGNEPSGTVVFLNKGKSLGSVTLSGGTASLTTAKLPAGSLALSAKYNGDTLDGKSTSTGLTQVVNQATTRTAVTSSPNPSKHGQLVKFTATVNSATTVPTGKVVFTAGSTTLGTVGLTKGVAKFNDSSLPVGTTAVTATYGGTANVAGSSGSVNQTVN